MDINAFMFNDIFVLLLSFCFCQDASSVSLAVKMNNSELCGRKIRVQRSHDVSKGIILKFVFG